MKSFATFFVDTYQKWLEDRAMRMAAALSYYTLFSLAPLLFVLTGVLGALAERFVVEIGIGGELGDLLADILGPEMADFILSLVEDTSESTAMSSSLPLISIVGLVITLWGASNIFNYLHEALNTIWGVRPIAKGGIVMEARRRALAFLIVFIAGALLVLYLLANAAVSIFVPVITSLVPETLDILPDFRVLQLSQSILLFCITTLLFAAFYRILPDVEITWRDVFVGAAFTSLLFGVGTVVLSIYFRFYTSSFAGAAGSLIVLLLWFYYSSQIFMYGAEFTYMYATRYGSKITPAEYTVAVNKTLLEQDDDQEEMGEPVQERKLPGHTETDKGLKEEVVDESEAEPEAS
ncbi:MAG TPA: YihY/virulence factor BrkB family protein [Anaerolineae bacterium]|nr:YihY/virulence factor BrkB family protein [Anaerolineae bacterium]